jgi:hypothetical protein
MALKTCDWANSCLSLAGELLGINTIKIKCFFDDLCLSFIGTFKDS